MNVVAVFRDPHTLIIDNNVRETFNLDDFPELADSIAEHGVLTPITAYGHPEDLTATVRDGQLRTLTAMAVGIEQVPVWLIEPDEALAAKDAEISRILTQITVNDRRIALTDGDRAAGIALALELGASVTRVGKALQTKRDEIKQAGKIGASATARKAVDGGQLDFEQAAILAEYENVGDTDAVRQLLDTDRGYFSYEARLIANDCAERRTYFTAVLPWAEAGFGVLHDYPDCDGSDPVLVHANDLVDANGDTIDVDQLTADAGWLVRIELCSTPLAVERDTGSIVDAATVDWNTEHDPDREPADGLRHAREVTQHDRWQADYFLPTDQLDAAGLRLISDLPDAEPTAIGISDDPDREVDDVLAREELAARRAEAEAEATVRREQERLAARRVRELNKQGLAAMEVRREFVTRLLARKTLPPEASKFIAEALVAEPALLGEYNAFETAAELLGGKGTWRRELQQVVETAKPARCQVIVLGLVLGAHEKRAVKDSWRYADAGVNRYLRFLQQVGHELVPVELAAVGDLDYERIDIDAPISEPDAHAA
ncbi:ParB/RepB/Spo0J family partition protein [Nocardia salmonicida]|uniref:ParB/RepB/Spo0J family partition protein n=1 Tax=Nocardia salmonicida TaxID=53431 RepID=UPI002E29A8B8|nr:ParB/RepB/Spo0J family partition protein [Nocardia salmonicida]